MNWVTNTITMCAKCGIGYLLLAPVHVGKCELCGAKEGVAVYDLSRSDSEDEREDTERESESGAGGTE